MLFNNKENRRTGALGKLARLSGAKKLPPLALYADGKWTGRGGQVLRLLYNLLELVLSRGHFLFVTGPNLRSVRGRVQLLARPTLRELFRGGLILRGASLASIEKELGLYSCPAPSVYLADAGVLVMAGQSKDGSVIVHVVDESARLERYHDGYRLAREALPASSHFVLPNIIGRDIRPYGHILYQQKLDGFTPSVRNMSVSELLEHTEAAFAVLQAIEVVGIHSGPPADADLYRVNHQKLMSCEGLDQFVTQALQWLDVWPLRKTACTKLAHGDYCFPNLLFSRAAQLQVSGVLDWEKARSHAVVGSDAFYLMTLSFAQWHRCELPDVLCMIIDDMEEPTLKRLTAMLRDAFSLESVDMKFLVLHFWTSYLAARTDELDRWGPSRRQRWLAMPAKSISQWISREKSMGASYPRSKGR